MATQRKLRRRYPRLARRAERQAAQDLRPAERRTNRQIGRIQRQGERAAQGTQRAGQAAGRFYRQAAQSVGPGVANAGMVRNQLGALGAQNQQFGQGLGQLSQKAARINVRGLREDQQAQRQDTTRSYLNEMVAERQKAQADQAEAQTTKRQERRSDAIDAASSLLNEYVVQSDGSMDQSQIPSDQGEWGSFRDVLQQQNPTMSPQQVELAIARLRARMATQASLPENVAGPTIREARPGVQRQLRRDYTQYFLGQ